MTDEEKGNCRHSLVKQPVTVAGDAEPKVCECHRPTTGSTCDQQITDQSTDTSSTDIPVSGTVHDAGGISGAQRGSGGSECGVEQERRGERER